MTDFAAFGILWSTHRQREADQMNMTRHIQACGPFLANKKPDSISTFILHRSYWWDISVPDRLSPRGWSASWKPNGAASKKRQTVSTAVKGRHYADKRSNRKQFHCLWNVRAAMKSARVRWSKEGLCRLPSRITLYHKFRRGDWTYDQGHRFQ